MGQHLQLCRCVTFQVGKDRTAMRLVPLPCNYVADLKEANMLLNIKHGPSRHCNIHTDLELSCFDNPDAVGELGTEKKMRKVCFCIVAVLPHMSGGRPCMLVLSHSARRSTAIITQGTAPLSSALPRPPIASAGGAQD